MATARLETMVRRLQLLRWMVGWVALWGACGLRADASRQVQGIQFPGIRSCPAWTAYYCDTGEPHLRFFGGRWSHPGSSDSGQPGQEIRVQAGPLAEGKDPEGADVGPVCQGHANSVHQGTCPPRGQRAEAPAGHPGHTDPDSRRPAESARRSCWLLPGHCRLHGGPAGMGCFGCGRPDGAWGRPDEQLRFVLHVGALRADCVGGHSSRLASCTCYYLDRGSSTNPCRYFCSAKWQCRRTEPANTYRSGFCPRIFECQPGACSSGPVHAVPWGGPAFDWTGAGRAEPDSSPQSCTNRPPPENISQASCEWCGEDHFC